MQCSSQLAILVVLFFPVSSPSPLYPVPLFYESGNQFLTKQFSRGQDGVLTSFYILSLAEGVRPPILEPDSPTGGDSAYCSHHAVCHHLFMSTSSGQLADSCQASNSLKKENLVWKVVIQWLECSQAPRAKIIRSASFPRSPHWPFCWPPSSVVAAYWVLCCTANTKVEGSVKNRGTDVK